MNFRYISPISTSRHRRICTNFAKVAGLPSNYLWQSFWQSVKGYRLCSVKTCHFPLTSPVAVITCYVRAHPWPIF